MDMVSIMKCNASDCVYNASGLCHTPGITVGAHAECGTFNHGSSNKAGYKDIKGGVGACLEADCKYNNQLECRAPNINVAVHQRHADCETFQQK